jgi:hypothetical protein
VRCGSLRQRSIHPFAPCHASTDSVYTKTQFVKHIPHEAVLFVAIATPPAAHQLVHQRSLTQVDYGTPEQRVDILKRNATSVCGNEEEQGL